MSDWTDFDGNGSYDPMDIGISEFLDDESSKRDKKPPSGGSGSGCLSTMCLLICFGITVLLVLFL
jgi:hypothetical protein